MMKHLTPNDLYMPGLQWPEEISPDIIALWTTHIGDRMENLCKQSHLNAARYSCAFVETYWSIKEGIEVEHSKEHGTAQALSSQFTDQVIDYMAANPSSTPSDAAEHFMVSRALRLLLSD